MPPLENPWSTDYPTSQDDPVTTNQPTLTDDTTPGALDGDRVRVSHLNTLRDKLDEVCKKVGDDSNLPVGTILDILNHDGSGDAQQLRLVEISADPTAVANKAFIYAKDDGGVTKVYIRLSDGTVIEVGAGGGGFTAYEEEFTAVAGANEFTLSTTPAVNANTLSGRNIHGVFRNGVRSRYKSSVTLANEYNQSGGNDKINVTGQSGGEIFTVVFGV